MQIHNGDTKEERAETSVRIRWWYIGMAVARISEGKRRRKRRQRKVRLRIEG